MNGDIYIHLGLYKTGTTFLQTEIFPRLKNVNYVRIAQKKDIPSIIHFKIDKKKINLISNESLGLYLEKKVKRENAFEMAKRIKVLYPKAKIILVLRDKEEWIYSFYKQMLRQNRYIPYKEWYQKTVDETSLDFEKYTSLLKELFDNVLILDYKLLKDNDKLFVKKICDFMDLPTPDYKNKIVYRSLKLRHFKFLNFCRRFFPKTIISVINYFFRKIN